MAKPAGCHFDFDESASTNFSIQTALKDPTAHVQALAEQPDFRLLTTLVWVRFAKGVKTPDGKFYTLGRTGDVDGLDITLCDRKPDLGLLKLHHDRLAEAAEALGWRGIEVTKRSALGLDTFDHKIHAHIDLLPELDDARKQWLKIRIMIRKNGAVEIDSTIMDEREIHEVIPRPFIPESFNLNENIHPACHVLLDSEPTQPSLFTSCKTSYRVPYIAARARANVSEAAPTEKEVIIYNEHNEITETSLCTIYFHRNGKWVTPAAICGGVVGVTRRIALSLGLCTQGLIEVADVVHGEHVWLSNAARGFFLGRIHLSKDQAARSNQYSSC